MTQTVSIYGLYDPRDGALRYVGKTASSLRLRVSQHMTPKELRLSHRRAKWLRCLKAEGLKPEARVIEVTTAEEWEARERHWILEPLAGCWLSEGCYFMRGELSSGFGVSLSWGDGAREGRSGSD